jgi:hypothetical protein
VKFEEVYILFEEEDWEEDTDYEDEDEDEEW